MAPWVDPDSYGQLYHPQTDADWDALVSRSEGGARFASILNVARRNGCKTVLVENRYIDADFRSDYSAFWSKRFDSICPFARRVHFFFRAQIEDAQLPRFPARPGYLGYSVLRSGPHQDGRIGRTILVPPRRLRRAITASVEDEVSVFGNTLRVRGAPWSEQDGEFLTCAHAAIWGCHYSAFRRGLVARRLTAELVALVPTLLSVMRALPSPGLTPQQIQAVFAATGQPALLYSLEKMPHVPAGVEDPSPTPDPANPNRPLPGLRVSPEKTRIVELTKGKQGFDFLGFHLRKVESWKWRGKWYLQRWPSTRAMKTVRVRIRELTDRRYAGIELETVVERLNPVIRGWGNYFRAGNSARKFSHIDSYVHERLAILASNKHKRSGRNWGTRFDSEWLDRLGVYTLTGTVRYRAAHAPR